jgi:hypothetical protein
LLCFHLPWIKLLYKNIASKSRRGKTLSSLIRKVPHAHILTSSFQLISEFVERMRLLVADHQPQRVEMHALHFVVAAAASRAARAV